MSSLQSDFNYQTQKQMQQLTSCYYFNTSNRSSQKCEQSSFVLQNLIFNVKKGKAIPLQAWTGPEGSRRLRLPDFKTIGT